MNISGGFYSAHHTPFHLGIPMSLRTSRDHLKVLMLTRG